MAEGIGGGTKIGESLATFNRWHAKSVIHTRTCVMIVSDGYDTGDPEVMAAEMHRLARRCKRIVWLNPMIGWEGYAPSARGMQAALPFIDLFAPAHNLVVADDLGSHPARNAPRRCQGRERRRPHETSAHEVRTNLSARHRPAAGRHNPSLARWPRTLGAAKT